MNFVHLRDKFAAMRCKAANLHHAQMQRRKEADYV